MKARTGNTHGIRFNSSPPAKARRTKRSAVPPLVTGVEISTGGLFLSGIRLAPAIVSGRKSTPATTAGVPVPAAGVKASSVSVGLTLAGERPFSKTSGVAGKNSTDGQAPLTRRITRLPFQEAPTAALESGCGTISRAAVSKMASKPRARGAPATPTASCKAASPGMHTSRHSSQVAFAFKTPRAPGRASAGTVSVRGKTTSSS